MKRTALKLKLKARALASWARHRDARNMAGVHPSRVEVGNKQVRLYRFGVFLGRYDGQRRRMLYIE